MFTRGYWHLFVGYLFFCCLVSHFSAAVDLSDPAGRDGLVGQISCCAANKISHTFHTCYKHHTPSRYSMYYEYVVSCCCGLNFVACRHRAALVGFRVNFYTFVVGLMSCTWVDLSPREVSHKLYSICLCPSDPFWSLLIPSDPFCLRIARNKRSWIGGHKITQSAKDWPWKDA